MSLTRRPQRDEGLGAGDGTERPAPRREGARSGRRALGAALSLAVHLGALLVLIAARRDAPAPPAAPTTTVTLVADPRPTAPPTPDAAAPTEVERPRRAQPQSPLRTPRPRLVLAAAPMSRVATAEAGVSAAGVSEAELSGAATAGGGGGAGGCDMLQLVQTALRRDPLVRAAVASGLTPSASAKALKVWNGDWIASGGQDGKGLAAVREAVSWEVGFAPRACREAPVHGLVLISLADAPGAARLVIGHADWRWSDLLGKR